MAGPKKAKMGHEKAAKRVVHGEKARLIQLGGQNQSCTNCKALFGKDQMVVRYPVKDGAYYCGWRCSELASNGFK